MIYPCPPPSHISHCDSLAVCVAHPSGPAQRKERHMKTHGCFGAGTALSSERSNRIPEKCLPTRTRGRKKTRRKAAGENRELEKQDVLATHGVGNGFSEGTKSRFLLTD